MVCRILVHQLGIEPASPEACSLNHWTVRKVLRFVIFLAVSKTKG